MVMQISFFSIENITVFLKQFLIQDTIILKNVFGNNYLY